MLTVSGVSARTTAAMLGRPTVWWWGVLWCTTVLVVLVVVVILRSTVVTLTSMALVLRGSRTAIAGLSSVTARTLLLAVAVLRLSTITSLCAVLAGLRVLLGSGATVLVIAVLVASMLVATVLAARTLVGALVL